MQTIAGQAALNAQGNSGTIFSFTFTKLSAAVATKSKPSLAIAELAECLKEVAAGMTEAMSNPFPGTMLSVITDTFNAASASDVKDVETLVIALLNAGKASLLKTPDQLVVNGKKILKDRGVVDSGAQGFVLLLQGMADAIAGTLEYGEYLEVGTAADVAVDDGVVGTEEVQAGHDCDLTFQYCTECVAELQPGVTQEQVKELLSVTPQKEEVLGDSIGALVTEMAPGVSIAKVHIHSNDPERVFQKMRTLSKDGHLYKEKAEDMAEQVKLAEKPRFFPPLKNIGIMWTSLAEVPEDFHEAYKEGFVPWITTVDSASYKDRVELSPLAHFNLLRRHDFYKVGTSGWNVADVKEKMAELLGKYEKVIVVTLPWVFSRGGKNAFEQMMEGLSEKDRSRVFSWQHRMVGSEGSCVMRAHWLASKGGSVGEVIDRLNDWVQQESTFSVTYIDKVGMVRKGGRLAAKDKGPLKVVLNFAQRKGLGLLMSGDYIEIDDETPGAAKLAKGGFGSRKGLEKKFVKTAVSYANKARPQQYDCIVSHSACPHQIKALVAELKENLDLRNMYFAEMSTLSGSQLGPNAVFASFWPADEMQFAMRITRI